jgi:hypothetical protein
MRSLFAVRVLVTGALLLAVAGCEDRHPFGSVPDGGGQDTGPVLEGTLEVKNSENLASFAARGYVRITGDLQVLQPGLTSLTGMESLLVIDGNLKLASTTLTSVSGLGNVTRIGGTISLDDSIPSQVPLRDLSGLSSLREVGGLDLQGARFTSMKGLEQLTAVHGDVSLFNVELLSDLSGLRNVTTIDGTLGLGLASFGGLQPFAALRTLGGLRIENAPGWSDLGTLGSVTVTGAGELAFVNTGLTSLRGVPAAATATALTIAEDPGLTSLDGLEQLTMLGELVIQGNDHLSSLSGLDNLTSVTSDIRITGNALIDDCQAVALATRVQPGYPAPGDVIAQNGDGSDGAVNPTCP